MPLSRAAAAHVEYPSSIGSGNPPKVPHEHLRTQATSDLSAYRRRAGEAICARRASNLAAEPRATFCRVSIRGKWLKAAEMGTGGYHPNWMAAPQAAIVKPTRACEKRPRRENETLPRPK